MPRLLLFVPCERVIVEEGANTVSLIALLSDITVSVPPSKPLADDAVTPLRWYSLAIWERAEDDENKQFEQRVALTDPSGKIRLEALAPLNIGKGSHRSIGALNGFPIGIPGRLELALFLREQKGEWKQITAYPLKVIHDEQK